MISISSIRRWTATGIPVSVRALKPVSADHELAHTQCDCHRRTTPTVADRLFGGTCFGGVALNRDVGTCWHCDDGDVPWGQTCVSIVAWGAFGGGALRILNGSHIEELAMGSE